MYTASISDHLILIVRHAICGGADFAEWQPEVEMWINHVNDPEAAVAAIDAAANDPT